MTIQALSVAVGATLAPTGGTATGVISKGQSLDSHVTVLNDSSAFIDQTLIAFSIKDPKVSSSAPNGYTQARSSVKISVPLDLDNGNRTVNTLSISLSVDPETTAAEIQALLVLGAQLLFDSDCSDFWKKQSLS